MPPTPAVGEELSDSPRTTGPEVWNRFAAVNDEFVDIHMDDEAARRAGLPGAIGMGLLQVSYLHRLIRTWTAGRGRLASFSCRFTAMNTRGQEVRARGVVTDVQDGQVRLEVWTEDQGGNRLANGSCTVLFEP